MTHSLTRCTLALCVAALLIGATARGDDPKTQVIGAGELRFEVPEGWKQTKPSSSMRKAQIQIPPAEGDKEPAEMVLYVFPGGAGTVEANVERWRQQFKDASGQAPEIEQEKVKGKNVEVTRVEAAGIYTDPFAGAGAKPHYRLLGAIVQTGDAGYFFKLVGPDKTVKDAEDEFDAMLASMARTE